MIIDLILDRKDGKAYDASNFYYSVMEYRDIASDASDAITSAMDYGTNEDVQAILCNYIDMYGYNMDICKYIKGQRWI